MSAVVAAVREIVVAGELMASKLGAGWAPGLLSTERGWSVEQLARDSGLSVGIVSQIERGQGNPALSTCSALAARMRSTRAQVVPPMEPLGDDHSAACIRVHELARAPG